MLRESCKNSVCKRATGLCVAATAGLLLAGMTGAAVERQAHPTRTVTVAAAPALPVSPAAHRAIHPLPHFIRAARSADQAHRVAVTKKLVGRRVLEPKAPVSPRATVSLYERTVDRGVLRAQGCSAARRGVGGVVILDFGKPAYNGHTYGTILFSGAFAGNKAITRALYGYAYGYTRCLRRGSHDRISLARGTSNYHPSVPSAYKAGRKWARETMQLSRMLRKHGLHTHVIAAAADDVEPAWDRSFHQTRDFFRGYRDARTGHLLYNYGSLDGGVGSIWNARQAFYVAGGMKYARAIPEIYNSEMAHQWAQLAHIAHKRYHRKLQIVGVMTEHTGPNRGVKPRDAHRMLVRELATAGGSRVSELPTQLTNIRSAD